MISGKWKLIWESREKEIHFRGVGELRTHFEEVGAHMREGALILEEWKLKSGSGNSFQE